MTPGVVANVREVISSSLRSWIIESLDHFGVDSRVFLHVIQSILEQDVRSLRGEDALDDLWRGQLASIGSKRGRDPKRQMNEDDLRRCVLLENMTACFKEDEFDAAEEFVDELLNRWTEEARVNVEVNGDNMKKSSQDLHEEEIDNEENKETKDPVREYNEAFPALRGSSTRPPSMANQMECAASETTGRQKRNCAVDLLKDLFHWSASSRNNPENVCSKESMCSSMVRAKCCREFAKSMARDFVNNSVAANTQQSDSVHGVCSKELLGHSNIVVSDLSRRFLGNELRSAGISSGERDCPAAAASSGWTLGDSSSDRRGLSLPSLQRHSTHELNSHLREMSNNTLHCPSQGEGNKIFPPLSPEVLSRTVDRILSQSLPCCNEPRSGPNTGGAYHECIQCNSSGGSGRLDFPIYTENEFGMLIRLGEDWNERRTNQRKGYGEGVIGDASHLVVGVGKDASPGSSGTLLSTEAKGKMSEEVDLSLHPVGSSGVRRDPETLWQYPSMATSGWKGGGADEDAIRCCICERELQQQKSDDADAGLGCQSNSHHSSVLRSGLFSHLNHDAPDAIQGLRNNRGGGGGGQCLTGKVQPGGFLPAPTHGKIGGAVETATASSFSQVKGPSDRNGFQCSGEINERSSSDRGHRMTPAAAEVSRDLTDVSMVGWTRPQMKTMKRNAEESSSVVCHPPDDGDDGALVASRDRDTVAPSASVSSDDGVLRLLADVIERDLMNHIAASLIPLFPDLSSPRGLFLPAEQMLAHLAARNCIPERGCADALASHTLCTGTCENDYVLYLHLAVRQESLHVDHVLNFQDFCVWRQCLLEQATSATNSDISCFCDLCHRALKHLASDSRYAFVDANTEEESRKPLPDSSSTLALESETSAKSEKKDLLRSEKQEPEKRDDDSGFHFSSKPAFVMNSCLQSAESAGTGDFTTGKFDGIMMNKVLPGGGGGERDGSHGCSSVGEGDVLLEKHSHIWDNFGVFGQNSLREIWHPDGDADRKSDFVGCSELKEENLEENNNILESFGWLSETGFSWPSLSQGVALGNSVNIWFNSGSSSLASAGTSSRKAVSTTRNCDKTVLRDIASDASISGASKFNTDGHAIDLGATSAGTVSDKVATICDESASTMCNRPFSDQSALITDSFGESSFSTASSCHTWSCADDVTETEAMSSAVAPSSETSELKRLSPSLERLLSSGEESSSSSVQSFQSALHEDFYSLWLNTGSLTSDHESGRLCAREVSSSSDCGSLSLGSDDDEALLRNSEAHYEADISSSDDSSLDERGSVRDSQSVDAMQRQTDRRENLPPSEADLLFGLSFPMPPSKDRCSFSSVVGIDDIVRTKHSKCQSSESSLDDSSDRSEMSKPYSADCNSSGEHIAAEEERKGLLSDWDIRQRRPDLDGYGEGLGADCYQTDSEDLEDPTTLCRNWEECSSGNSAIMMPACSVNLFPDLGNLGVETGFSGNQQEVVDFEKFMKLKLIWNESEELDDFKYLTSDCEPQESRSVNFKEESFSETFGQHDVQDDMKRRLPSCSDLECSASENYRKLAILWDQTKVESLTGARALWESNDLESLKALVPNQVVPELKGGSGVTPDWNMTEHPAENLRVLDADWNEQEPGGAMVLNWNTLHQPIGDGCTDQTSCWGQQWSKVENLKGSTLGRETVDDLKEFTEKHDTVVDDDNFKEVESIWVGLKSLESFKGDRTVRANPIEDVGNNSIHALVLECNEQESNSVNLRNLAGLKSLWEKEELHPETSSNDLKVDCWDLSQMRTAVDLPLGGGHQTTDNGSCKDLTELKLIWEENQRESCLASSRGVLEEQGWEMNPMGCVNVGNAKELAAQKTTMWDGNQRDGDDLLERESCDQQEVDSRNVERNLAELKFIWEDKPPPKAEVDLTTSYKSNSAILKKKLMPSCSDYNLLNAEELLGGLSATSNAQHQASNLEMSKGVRFIWESVDRGTDENANAPNWDQQQELGTENTARGLPDNGPLLTASDLEGCYLLTSIWERRESDSGRNTTWEVPGSRPEENAVVTMIPIFDTNHKVVAGYAGDNDDVGDVQNLAQSLCKGKQKNLESFIWDMNGNDGGETGVAGLATCDRNSQESDAEALKNQIQLESLWRESESKLRSAKLNWDMEPSDAENLMSLTPDQSQEDAGPPDSFQNLKSIWDEKLPDSESGLMLGWDVNGLDAAAHSAMRIASDQSQQQEAADPRNFQTLGQLKSIWEEKEPDTEHSKEPTNLNNWDISRMETLPHAVMGLPSCSNQQETDPPGNFLNLSEVKFIWEGKQSSSDNLEKAASCWEKQAPDLENRTWDKNQQTHSENLMMLKSGAGQQENEGCRNLKSIWEEQQPGVGSVKGPTSCWKQQGVESEVLKAGTTSNWNVTHLNSESFDNSLFDLNSQQLESENFESVMSSHGDIKQSNSEIFLDRKLPEPKCFQRPMSDRDLNYREFGRLATSNVDLWQSDSDELKQMISRWDKQQTEARGIRGLLSHFDSQQQSNLAAEWQLAEAVDQLTRSSDDATTASSLWRLASGRLNEQNNQGVLPKLVPSENSAFQDEIPRRFVYRYAFFDPRDVRRRGDDLATKDARTETIRHIYEPSNSIVRQLEDLFDDGQRLHSEQTLSNLPNCLFRPIGEQSSGRDSHQNPTTSTAGDAGDLSLQIKSPSGSDPSEVVEPNSPYQLYLGVESQAFVPRFRVHKELEKSAQTGEATPPAMQNNECVFGMNVILSTIALLE